MASSQPDPTRKELTPGPLSVSDGVGATMNKDVGCRDPEFIQVLILACGAYGARMAEICAKGQIPYVILNFAEDIPVQFDHHVGQYLSTGNYGSLALVHCETTSGILCPIEDARQKLKSANPTILYIVDAMSSFGGVVADYSSVDFLISSSNKCLQGVPGFAFVLRQKQSLLSCKGRSLSLCLDLFEQSTAIERNSQFRYTPPTHCILALKQAVEELEQEGGVAGRSNRILRIIKTDMAKLGFQRFILDDLDGHIITSFKYPKHPNFKFDEFYERLSSRGN